MDIEPRLIPFELNSPNGARIVRPVRVTEGDVREFDPIPGDLGAMVEKLEYYVRPGIHTITAEGAKMLAALIAEVYPEHYGAAANTDGSEGHQGHESEVPDQ